MEIPVLAFGRGGSYLSATKTPKPLHKVKLFIEYSSQLKSDIINWQQIVRAKNKIQNFFFSSLILFPWKFVLVFVFCCCCFSRHPSSILWWREVLFWETKVCSAWRILLPTAWRIDESEWNVAEHKFSILQLVHQRMWNVSKQRNNQCFLFNLSIFCI